MDFFTTRDSSYTKRGVAKDDLQELKDDQIP